MSDTQALAVQQSGAMVAPESAGAGFLAMIERAARDPNVDPAKLSALLGLKERVDAKQAEIEFNQDFSLASMEMPRVAKRGTIKMVKDGIDKGSIPFAKYEDLDRAIRPIEGKYGFTRSFTTKPAEQSGIIMTVNLAHRGGHSISSTRFMPPDPGPGRNAMQAIGSASSYAKRYLTLDIWNIVTEGADNDGSTACPITQDQVNRIYDMIAACEMDIGRQKKLLEYANAANVEQIQSHRFNDVMGQLQKALKQKNGGAR